MPQSKIVLHCNAKEISAAVEYDQVLEDKLKRGDQVKCTGEDPERRLRCPIALRCNRLAIVLFMVDGKYGDMVPEDPKNITI